MPCVLYFSFECFACTPVFCPSCVDSSEVVPCRADTVTGVNPERKQSMIHIGRIVETDYFKTQFCASNATAFYSRPGYLALAMYPLGDCLEDSGLSVKRALPKFSSDWIIPGTTQFYMSVFVACNGKQRVIRIHSDYEPPDYEP